MRHPRGRRVRALAAAGLALSAGAWVTTAPADAAQLRPAQLRTALLTAEDLPRGFVERPGGGAGDVDEVTAEDACSRRWLAAETRVARLTGTALSAFVRGDGDATIVSAVNQFAAPGSAKAYVAAARARVTQCPTARWQLGDGVTMTMTHTPLSVPRQGEESLALSVSTTIEQDGEAVPARGTTVVVRRGAVLSSVHTTVVAGPVPRSAALAARVSARLQQALRS
ncbi:hypothetical protein [Motilibacter aurantiacus]|uniref:hypothetical protein n=1 Tax=Motilibacter aurantiacus TaxID=2714955 RepID=UPI00140B7ABB|nr:hypothetical protein [Motilibacter aurantiacus]NHC47562.1 hypothetical protein [Motilibacter aurantiacus]